MTEAASTATKEVVEKITQNGIVRPREGTATARVWTIAEDLSNAAGEPAKRGEVMKACEAEGINTATVATQYGKWRKFHGIVAAPKAPKEPKAPKAKKVKAEAEVEAGQAEGAAE